MFSQIQTFSAFVFVVLLVGMGGASAEPAPMGKDSSPATTTTMIVQPGTYQLITNNAGRSVSEPKLVLVVGTDDVKIFEVRSIGIISTGETSPVTSNFERLHLNTEQSQQPTFRF
ncbi:Conserved hypothetical secreted protein [Pseudomonas veronii 1YdBTEX2]|jgi:hypothetical protein|uniref:Pilus formation protein N-terminal domain-containing protein n=2 Tax=Pseudomonas veronii TaxID=76761 RepID=A0A7Y1ADB8_PSEVE|nr:MULTISPECIES: hypothetical protein [Pseudomonas]SBW84042.1 Conserved hypothetical secreted protein [Pseudomonas veronii 1YdBTEX2]MBI6556967.1 hypothetical protein [Pseudomonas veronii]MBI6653522.1 hypothetical protein [Pseudomonas veronii]MBJ2180039.1 hypothetical protein [Pseudomonas veronii]MDB1108901.1 hypothetical protein [Pseudomonas extremaustralis]